MTLIRRHPFRSIPLLLLALAATTSARAAGNYLKVIPSTTLVWGVVNHMNEASDKIQKLAAIVQAPAVNLLEKTKKEWGITKGLDEKGAVGAFTLPAKTGKAPADVFFVAVADYQEFLSNFEVAQAGDAITEIKCKDKTSRLVAERFGYALIATKGDRAALEAALEAKQDISAETAGLESWLAENDATVVGTAAGIKAGAQQAREELKKSKEGLNSAPDFLISIQQAYDKILEATPSELALALGGIRCDKQCAIRVVGRARLVNGGEVSKAVAGIPPLAEKLFAAAPGGPFVLAAGGVGIPKLADAYLNLIAGFMKSMKSVYGMSAEDLERMSKESFEVFRQVHSMNFVMKTGKRGDPIYSNMFGAMRVDNSQRFLDLLEKAAEKANQLMQNAKQGALKSMTVKRLEIAGKPALQQEMSFDLSSMAGPESNRALMDEMMGIGGKMLYYYVAADEHTVLMGMGVSQERMAAALDVVKQPRKSLAEDADVSVTAAMLPADSQWVAYMSPRGYMQLIQRVLAVALKDNPAAAAFSLPPFPKCPPVGFAVKAEPTELRAEIAVPAELLKATGEYVQDMQKMMMQRMLEQNQTPAP